MPRGFLAVVLLAIGCSSSSDPSLADAADATGADAEAPADTALDALDATDASDATDATDADAACHDLRHFGDRKQPSDTCWDPPLHYCADGAGLVITIACAPDASFCCEYSNTCIPCGFTECSCGAGACVPAGCDTIPRVVDATRCRRPDAARAICWDGVDAK